jgi:thiol:disulfide interchange protein
MSCRFSRVALLLLFLCASLTGFAQDSHTKWSVKFEPSDTRAGETGKIVMTATVAPGWHIYGMSDPNASVPTKFALKAGSAVEQLGQVGALKPLKKMDDLLKKEVDIYEGKASFEIPVRIKPDAKGEIEVVVEATAQACNAERCDLPFPVEVPVKITVAEGEARADRTGPPELTGEAGTAATTTGPPAGGQQDQYTTNVKAAREGGLFSYLWFCFVAGLAALLTPCVFPMIPITVSFFSKRSEGMGGKPAYGPAGAYCGGIIGMYTALGVVVAVIFGASGIQKLAANPYLNLGLALLFIVLAANLFGLFEIRLPSSLVNKVSSGTRSGSIVAPLLMGLTFTLTSFTCTVPIVATLLIGASQGDLMYPILGMLAFSTAFALPFFLLALFPQFITRLPKSGAWMVTVKAFMGFLELAAALKFISNADLVWELGLLTRPVFLAIWAVIGVIGGLYMIGWLLLGNESGRPAIGWPRRIVGIATLVGGIYCLAGIDGANMGELSSFLPPDPYPGRKSATAGDVAWIRTYGEAAAISKAQGKPMLINFTGVT